MACIYVYNNKTYTKEDLLVHMMNNPQEFKNFKGTDTELEQIANKIVSEETIATDSRSFKRLKDLLESQVTKLRKRLKEYEDAKERRGYIPKQETLNKIKDLLDSLRGLEERDSFIKLMEYVKNELDTIHTFLDGSLDGKTKSKFDPNNEDHIRALIEIKTQMQTYGELANATPDFVESNDFLNNQEKLINKLHKNILESIDEKLESHLIKFVKENTKRDIKDSDIKDFLKSGADIHWTELKFGGLSNSADMLLQLLHKHIETKREEVYERTNEWREKLNEWSKRLKTAGVEGFDWMLQKSADGKLNGRFAQKINAKYWKTRYDLKEKLQDETGNIKQYIVKPYSEMTDEDKAYNLQLQKDKKAFRDFLNAEQVDISGKIKDGLNHKYNQEFKQARDTFEEYRFRDETKNYGWEKKEFREGITIIEDGVTKVLNRSEYDRYYTLFKRKYYTEPSDRYVAIKTRIADNTYVHKGAVAFVSVSYVKPEYVEVITDDNGKPTEFGDKDYYKIMNDNSTSGKVKKEFYDFYVHSSNELFDKLPTATSQKMRGKLFRVQGKLSQDISDKGVGFFNMMKRSIRNFINPDIIISGRELDEQGNLIEDVPIFYTGDLKSDKFIIKLETKLQELRDESLKNPKDNTLKDRIKALKNKILIEKNKLTAEEINTDLIESLFKGAQMAENYDLMKDAESTLIIAKRAIENKKFYRDEQGKEVKKGQSNVEQRLNAYMRMIFYNNSDVNNNKISKVLQNFGAYTSIKALGLNPFSSINNAIMANINTRIEGFGKQFGWNNTHLNKATVELNKYLAGGSYLGHFMDKFSKKNPYDSKPSNKFEAMAKHFNWFEKLDDRHVKGTAGIVNEILYIGLTAGEFTAQSRSAIAKLLATKIVGKDGTKTNLWEAYEFKDGQLIIKDNFKEAFLDKERRILSVELKAMNKIIHGNYSSNDKVAIQEHALGQLALQFKRWMYNFGRNRFGNTYFDETTGNYQEGRYRTFLNLLRHLKAGSLRDFKVIIGQMSDFERQNLKKLQVESVYWFSSIILYYLFDALSEGIDDDDKELKRIVNWAKRQSDRVSGELDAMINPKSIYSSVKNPVAGIKVVQQLGTFITEAAHIPLYEALDKEEDLKYHKGPYKGEYKIIKAGADLIPIIQLKAQYNSLLTSGNFYYR